jgi:hypothetical protein
MIETILRAEASERVQAIPLPVERSALDCLARLVESLDAGEGVDHAVAEARATLERLRPARPG